MQKQDIRLLVGMLDVFVVYGASLNIKMSWDDLLYHCAILLLRNICIQTHTDKEKALLNNHPTETSVF